MVILVVLFCVVLFIVMKIAGAFLGPAAGTFAGIGFLGLLGFTAAFILSVITMPLWGPLLFIVVCCYAGTKLLKAFG
jgi:NADH:ubiquinone oxidoreductase subunit 3 (subunit A)